MLDEDLAESQLAELRALLETARAEVEQGVAASSEEARPVDLGLSIGRLTRMDALQQQHMAMARRQRTTVRLQQIRSALARLDAGTYGDCVVCGEPIGHARLRARPESPTCRDCQSSRDR